MRRSNTHHHVIQHLVKLIHDLECGVYYTALSVYLNLTQPMARIQFNRTGDSHQMSRFSGILLSRRRPRPNALLDDPLIDKQR